MNRIFFLLLLGVAVTLGSHPVPAQATELIVNGGFETGDLTGWTLTNEDLGLVYTGPGAEGLPNSGTYFFSGFDNTGFATLVQSTNVVTSIGSIYDFSFFYNQNFPEAAGNILRYQIGSDPIVTVPNSASAGLWTQATDSYVADSILTSINIFFQTDDGAGTHRIDDVSFSAIPEPTSLALGSLGLLGLLVMGLFRRRRV